MMMKKRIRHSVLLALAVAAPLAAQGDKSGVKIPLRFGWEPGMRAEVDFEQVRVLREGSQSETSRYRATYRMEVSAHARGLAIDYSGMRWTELAPPDPENGRFYEAVVRVTHGARPRSVVSRTGEFVGVEGAEEVGAQTGQALQPLLAGVGAAVRPTARAMITAALAPGALRLAAVDEWNLMVGTWAGNELELGELYTMESSFRSPVFGNVTIPIHAELRVVKRVRCTEQEVEERCVELTMSSAPDQEMVARAYNDFLERSGAPADEVQAAFSQLRVQSSLVLHTDPRTLRPYYMQTIRNATGNPGADSIRQTETRTFRFRYPE